MADVVHGEHEFGLDVLFKSGEGVGVSHGAIRIPPPSDKIKMAVKISQESSSTMFSAIWRAICFGRDLKIARNIGYTCKRWLKSVYELTNSRISTITSGGRVPRVSENILGIFVV